MVTAMLVNFTLVCVTLIFIHKINPEISAEIKILKSVKSRNIIGSAGAILLILFLIIQTQKDLTATGPWYFHSTWIYLIVMFIATLIFVFSTGGSKDNQQFKNLPNT
jgi:APA family basic amino acid/polyamine antiporter